MEKQPKKNNKKHLAHAEVVHRQSQMIWYGALGLIALVIALVAYGILSPILQLQYGSVATVNGDRITATEFQGRVKLQRGQLISQFQQYYQFAQMFGAQDPMQDPNFGQTLQGIAQQLQIPETVGQGVLDALIDERLIRQQAVKMGISVSKEEVDQAMQEQFRFYPDGTPTTAPTATAFATQAPATLSPTQLTLVTITPTALPAPSLTPTATLDLTLTPTSVPTATAIPTQEPTALPEPTATPYTLAGYQTRVAESMKNLGASTGLNDQDFRALVESGLLREKVMAEVVKDLQPADDYVWAQHILVATEADAQALIDRLNKGEDWNKLAAELSQDTSNAQNGGDLGYFGHGQMVVPFEEAAFALTEIGQISAPVQSDFGWHVIRLLGREQRPLSAQDFDKLKQTTFSKWLKDLRAQGAVTVDETFWKSIVPTEPVLQ